MKRFTSGYSLVAGFCAVSLLTATGCCIFGHSHYLIRGWSDVAVVIVSSKGDVAMLVEDYRYYKPIKSSGNDAPERVGKIYLHADAETFSSMLRDRSTKSRNGAWDSAPSIEISPKMIGEDMFQRTLFAEARRRKMWFADVNESNEMKHVPEAPSDLPYYDAPALSEESMSAPWNDVRLIPINVPYSLDGTNIVLRVSSRYLTRKFPKTIWYAD